MTRVIQFRPFGLGRRRTLIAPLNPPNRTNPRYSEPSRSFRALSRVSRMRFLRGHLHQLASTCTNLQKKNCAQNCKQSGSRQCRFSHLNRSIRTCRELTGATGSYRDLKNVKTFVICVICAIRGHPTPTRVPTFGVIWCYLVQFGALWS